MTELSPHTTGEGQVQIATINQHGTPEDAQVRGTKMAERTSRDVFREIKALLKLGQEQRAFQMFEDNAWYRKKDSLDLLVNGHIMIDTKMREVRFHDVPVQMGPRRYALLKYFMQHVGVTLSSKDILTNVWGPAQVDNVQYLRVAIAELRQWAGDDKGNPHIFVNIFCHGYRMEAL